MKLFFYLIVLTGLCSSCQIKTSPKVEAFKTFVPDSTKTIPYNVLDISKYRSKLFNLPQIDKGVDSFELRIWVTSGMLTPNFATIVRYTDSHWVAHRYIYYKKDNVLDSLIVRRINLTDSIGSVVSYLSDTAILNLPSQEAIPGFVDNVADGQDCTIEISTKTFYKALSYHCPELFSDPYNKKFMGIVTYLNPWFHFYLPMFLPG